MSVSIFLLFLEVPPLTVLGQTVSLLVLGTGSKSWVFVYLFLFCFSLPHSVAKIKFCNTWTKQNKENINQSPTWV